MKVRLALSADTLSVLHELEDQDGIEPAKRVHKWLRELVFNPQPPSGASWCAEVSAARQRGSFRWRDQEVSWADITERAGKFQPAEDAADGGFEVVFSQRVGDLLPRVIALNDLRSSPEERRTRLWSTLEEFIETHVTSECAKADAAQEAREADDEEKALYPVKPKGKA